MGSWQRGTGPPPTWGGSGKLEACVAAFAARDATKLPKRCRSTKVDMADAGLASPVLAFWSFYQPIAFWRPGKRRHVELDCRDYSVATGKHLGEVASALAKAGVSTTCAVLPFPATFGPHREGILSPRERWAAVVHTSARVHGGTALRRALAAAARKWRRATHKSYAEVDAIERRLREEEGVVKTRHVERLAKRYAAEIAKRRKAESASGGETWDPATGEIEHG